MQLRDYRHEDDDALNRLKRKAFVTGMDRMRLDFWRWQYSENPAGEGRGIVAVDGDEIFGFIGYVPKRAQVDGRVVMAAQLVDYMVDPGIKGGYLGASIIRRVHTAAEQAGYCLTVGHANRESFAVITSRRVGMRYLFSPPVWLKPLRGFTPPSRRLSRGIARIGARVAMGGAALLSAAFRPARLPPAVVISEVAAADPRFDALWETASPAPGVVFIRDAAYVQWRFLRHPVYRYDVLIAEEHGRMVGYIVLTERSLEGLRVGQIIDSLIAPAVPRAAAWLLAAALTWARRKGVDVLATAALPGMRVTHDLRRAGYFRVPKRLEPFSVRVVARCFVPEVEARVGDASAWSWTWGDADVA